MKASKYSLIRKLVNSQEKGENIFEYIEIKRKISEEEKNIESKNPISININKT